MKRVLLIINNQTYTRTMLRWEQVIAKSGTWEPVIFCPFGDDLHKQMESLGAYHPQTILTPDRKIGNWQVKIQVANEVEHPLLQKEPVLHYQPPLWREIAKKILGPLLKLKVLITTYRVMLAKYRLFNSIVTKNRIDVMVICDTSPAYDAPVYIKVAKKNKIPVVSSPIDRWSADVFGEVLMTDKSLFVNSFFSRCIASIFPKWVMKYKSLTLFRLKPEIFLAHELLGMGHPKPWEMVGTWEDAVAVNSKEMEDFFREQNVPSDLLFVIGAPEYTMMYNTLVNAASLRENLYAELGLPGGKPMLLSALPQDHFLTGRPEAEYQEYGELMEAWVKPLGEMKNFNSIVSPHPSMDLASIKYLEKFGVTICSQDVSRLIPMCDLYIAQVSTTIQWAISCGKPVLNYDIYRYSIDVTSQAYPNSTTQTVLTNEEYRKVLNKTDREGGLKIESRSEQNESEMLWGKIDGKDGERLIALFESLQKQAVYN